jgi:hypothetical protein
MTPTLLGSWMGSGGEVGKRTSFLDLEGPVGYPNFQMCSGRWERGIWGIEEKES